MNIAQPIASEVDSVEFKFLTSEEIRAISVRRIENESTFDNLLNPVPGGLYDPALGSWGDSPCSTCNLNQAYCPGHAGHIQLPVPVYHPIFMDQAFRLLRATCVYCKGFRLPAKHLHLYTCQLRLLQHGLLNEALSVGLIGDNELALDIPNIFQHSDEEAEEEGAVSVEYIIRRREKFVSRCLRENKVKRGDIKKGKHEGASAMRYKIVKDFLSEITRSNTCANCGGISPAYRRDRCVKIFEKALSKKEKAKMAMNNLVRQDALTRMHRMKQKVEKPYSETDDHAFNEGVADVRSPTLDRAEVIASHPPNESTDARDDEASSQRFITSMEVKARLEELFIKEQELLMVLYNARPPTRSSSPVNADMFFMTMILVPPNRFRPEARTGDSQIAEAQQNNLYKSIMKGCGKIARAHKLFSHGKTGMDMMYQAWTQLQESVNALIDKDQNPVRGAAAKRNEDGIKQKLEKKEGLFRMNLMGKRVNFAARSVISPDPNIETNEIGVPPVFARKLTYPEPVTSHNFRDMQQAVVNGVEKWPGAAAIENESGQVVTLRNKSTDERLSLANQLLAPSKNNAAKQRNKKVHRHLTNGDVVLMNRQPTLHKPSIMGHRVRVLPGEKTLRMHYANCNTYNADFDGDEMNLHFPQNEVARAEALQISDTDHQYISGTAGNPLRGLIQDHVSIAVVLCSLDTSFTKQGYCQLLYSALRPENGHITGERIQIVPPAIVKPAARWTGKQIITSILKNVQPPNCGSLTLRQDAQIKAEQWGDNSEEGSVQIIESELITGILDKSQIGSTSGGLIHAVHEVYGPAVAGRLLSSLGRLLTRYLSVRAFSCGMDDLRLTERGERLRQKELRATKDLGLKIASEYVSLSGQENTSNQILFERLEEVLRDDGKQEGLDLLMNQGTKDITSAVQKACIPDGLEKPFPVNQMQVMTTSGAKGSRVNACLISCNLGQQNLEGRRVPLMVSGKSLPCFKPFDTSLRAAGYIVNRFLTGIRPQEYYFHHMAGREGLIDTAVKTSRSGYLQRCLIKGLEGLTVAYDTTVRDSDGSMIQFLYGEDGIDISKQKYLLDFKFILQNVASEVAQLRYDPQVGERLGVNRAAFCKYMKSAIKHAKAQDIYGKDPLASFYNPATNAFVTSEKFYESMSGYLKGNKDGLVRDKGDHPGQRSFRVLLNRKNAEMLFAMKYLRSLIEPGEAVGIVAGQSVGEPSTQMTLNTFHLAGHSARNVTQGIPRLREILMTASDRISHPCMTLYPLEQLSEDEIDKFARSISILRLGHLLDDIVVEERIGRGKIHDIAKIFDLRLNLFSSGHYAEQYGICANEVYDAIEKRLLPLLVHLVNKEIKKRRSHATTATPDIGAKAGVEESTDRAHEPGDQGIHESLDNNNRDDDEDDDDGDDSSRGGDEPDLDATNSKQRARRNDAVSYGPNDDDDDAVQKANEREALASDIEDEGIDCGSPDTLTDQELEAIEDTPGHLTQVEFSSAARRAERIMQAHHEITAFTCDQKKGSWCRLTLEYDVGIPKVLMLKIAQEAVRKTVVQQIRGVGLCNSRSDERGGILIEAEGINLRAMQRLGEQIDVDRIKTNDVAAVLAMYGVEACRKSIVGELIAVFVAHAIKVDIRHLNLIADHMTRNGDFTAFSRIGLGGSASPFTKMSFETTLSFLKDAVLDGDWDELVTPSSRLVMGRLGAVGTGGFDILTQVPTCQADSMA